MKRVVIVVFFLKALLSSYAQQTPIDSLLKGIDNTNISEAYINSAINLPYDVIVNELNKSALIFESLHSNLSKQNNALIFAKVKEKLALIYYLKGKYSESATLHLEAISLFEKKGQLIEKANAMANLAYEGKKRNLKSSINLMWEAIQIMQKEKERKHLAALFDNYGVLLELNKNLDSALIYYNQALLIKKENNDSIGLPYSLNNIAGIYFMQNKISEGLELINQSNKIRQNLKDFIGIAWNEYALGEMYYSNNKINDAKYHFQQSYSISNKVAYPDLRSKNQKYLAAIFSKQKRFDSAYYFLNTFFVLHDSLYNSQNQQQILEMETIFETEKKTSQIKLLNIDNKLKEQDIKKKKNTQNFLILIITLSILTVVFILRAYLQKIKTNKIIVTQKLEVEKQKHLVDEKQKEITDSIKYAKRIQYALLAHDDLLKQNLQEHFVFFKPKDIVSGDFYWATSTGSGSNEKFYIAVCDSTGHGVPGAFMSLLNIGFLNEAINEKNIEKPNDIFNYVRLRLEKTITQEGQYDGMDGILICYDKHANTIEYSAANNAPCLIKNNEFIELEKDRMPVGKGIRQQEFKLFSVDIQQGDYLYLYTDGFADQFGGERGKKFKYKALNELLLTTSKININSQKEVLRRTFDNWKGDLEQVDDVLIVGFRV